MSPSGSVIKLMSPNGRELDIFFKRQRFKLLNSFTFPHFLSFKTHTRKLFPIFLKFIIFELLIVCWEWITFPSIISIFTIHHLRLVLQTPSLFLAIGTHLLVI